MNDFANVVYVDLIKSKMPRKQPWRWVAKSAGNNRKLATSGESYTNEADAIAAVVLLFGDRSTAFLRRSERGNETLRRALPL